MVLIVNDNAFGFHKMEAKEI
ncbi:hypothetical protein [Candidatus Kuenenia stuttgartensis]